jgi:hypothetical protein
MRTIEIKCYLTPEELQAVQARADRELSDPGLWIRRVAVAVADGSASVIASQREGADVCA